MIPDWLGGPSFCPIVPEGGLVPKTYYMSVEEFEKDQSPGPHLLEDSFYNSASSMFILFSFDNFHFNPSIIRDEFITKMIYIYSLERASS